MEKTLCPTCGKGILEEKHKTVNFTYDGQVYKIPNINILACPLCNEEVLSAQEIRKMEKLAQEKAENRYTGKLVIRIDSDLHEKLTRISRKNKRSLNQEIAFRLEQSLK